MQPSEGFREVKNTGFTGSSQQLQGSSLGSVEVRDGVAAVAQKVYELTRQVPPELRETISNYFSLVPIATGLGAVSNLFFGSFSSCFSWGLDAQSTICAVKSGRQFVQISDSAWQDTVKGAFVVQACKLGYNAGMLLYTRDLSYLVGAGVNALILVETANRLEELGVNFKPKVS